MLEESRSSPVEIVEKFIRLNLMFPLTIATLEDNQNYPKLNFY